MKTSNVVEWRCIPLLVFYRCDITEGRSMEVLLHGVAVKVPSVQGMAIGRIKELVVWPVKDQ